jgi:thioredoxin reductase (NADPH)
MGKTIHSKVLIIGSGPAGYTAGIYAARANLEPVLVAGLQPGGQITITNDVENYPGFESIKGPELMDKMRAHAEHAGATMVDDIITSVDFSQRPFRAEGESGTIYTADSVIVATGAKARWLGLESETRLLGRGVSGCATCDGPLFKGREVVVVGGGNAAVEEALFLSNFCSKVTLVHRRDSLRAEKVQQDKLFRNPKIDVVWDSTVEEILGDAQDLVSGVRLKNVKTGAETLLPAEGVFVAIGHDPATELFKGQLALDKDGYVVTAPDSTATSIPGVFAAGDVKDKVFRQAATAIGSGCAAALEAERWLAGKDLTPKAAPEIVPDQEIPPPSSGHSPHP